MSLCNVVTLWFCVLTTFEFTSGLQQYGINVITTRTYSRVRYSTSCGFLWLGRCSRYSRRSRLTFHCKPGYRSDDNIGCPHKTCSWRSDSTRCYPGTCTGEYASNCSCSSGFTGQHCQTITTEPTIYSKLFRFTTSGGDTAMVSSMNRWSTTWSNIKSPSRMYYKFTAKYKMVPPSKHAFIQDFRVGIIGGSASFKLKRRRSVVSTKMSVCGGASRSSPETDLFTCEGNPSMTSVLTIPFQHKDVIVVSYKATNGGYVKVRNKETKNLTTFFYSGDSETRTFTITIDLVPPFHCTGSSTCVGSMLTAPNVIKTPTLNLRWSDWSDADAGVDHFVRDVYELHAVGDVLRDKRRIDKKTFTSYKTSDKFRVFKSGVYSVVLSVYDKAGNYRRARRFVVYDGTSSVTTRSNKKLRVMTAASTWQTTSSSVTVDWTNRYINTVHHSNKWLHGVASLGDVGSGYDDNEGSRGIGEVRNVQGITGFLTSYKVDHKGGSSITSPPADNLFTSQGLNQSQTITPSLVDGDTVRFWVRAYDIRREFLEEHVTVHIDTSPPIMENLWLIRGVRLNISIHRVEELHDVIMEFDVHDEHSGVETLEWRIVEKRLDEDIALATHDISIQSQRTLDDCNTMHDERDGNCYCTPAGTCYHPHFQVKPALADIRDVRLAEGKEYWFQVTATNHAKLKTEQEVKIQMDASPPHTGVVHDGQSGQPEVDYQDSLQLHAHWDGFFDRESAVILYQYTFGSRCLHGHLFDLIKTKTMESTRSTEATWTAPSCGKFYITVVAYNAAQQRSDAVCSDGVETCKSKKTCSWRRDSTRCYPGTCTGEYAGNCSCSSGFTGQHCQTITTEPTIYSKPFRLTTNDGDTAMVSSVINSWSTTWSNVKSPSRMYYKFTAKYNIVPPSRHSFIEDFRVGIVGGSASFKLKRRQSVVSTKMSVCGGASRSSPETDLYTCEGNSSVTSVLPLPFQHRDVIVVSYKATNGGYVKVRNKETKNLATFYYSGASKTRTFTMTTDLVPPYHCTGSSTCVGSMLTAPNVITTPTLNLRWSGWSDADAGVDHFVRDVYELHAVGDVLRDKRRIDKRSFTSSKTSDKFRVFKSGVYSVVLSVYDKAGNYRRARRIVVNDGTSSVTTRVHNTLRVMTAASEASAAWQRTSSIVKVDWTNRYINTVHHSNKWLLGVASLGDIGSGYDDNEGSRGIDEVRNVQGITGFLTSYKVDHKGGSSITSPPADNLFTSQGLNQSQTITPSLVEGDTVRFWVRAYDIRHKFLEEHVTVHIDTSPPVIEKLWLTRSGNLNTSIHRVEELHDVIIEFDVHDEHSGVETLEWRIVEKRLDEDIVLATHDISIQSQRTLDDCNTMHDERDGNCYCTPAGTCYHPHFQVKPALADMRDVKLAEGKEYWFQVTATNHAKLKTEQEVKIQMDASPPHTGVVHDGQSGQPEVDYQDSLQLHAHWDGFFDRESAVILYQYTFGSRCLQGYLLDFNETKTMESTRTTEATWTAPSCGKFYITVVAYNGGQQRSDAVCSDGVETCKPSPVLSKSEGNPIVGKNLVLMVSATASAVVAVAGIVVGVVVWKRKRRGQPETSDQAVYYNTGSFKSDKPKKRQPRDKRSKPEAKTYDTLDVTTRETVPEEEPYCSIQTSGSDETNLYEPVECQIYVNSGVLATVMSNSTSDAIYE